MHSASIPKPCEPARSDPGSLDIGLVHRSLSAMGCRFEMILDPNGSPHDRYSVEAIADEMVELVRDWHNRLTVFSPASIISRINAAPAGTPVRIDRDLFELLRLCGKLCEQTHGAFNIAAGTLMHRHGFRGHPPPRALEPIDLRHAVVLDDETTSVTRADECVSLDFGGIGKGFVLDLIRAELRSYGIANAFVHGGGSSAFALGCRPDNQPWRVGIGEDPRLSVCLRDNALGVSEPGGRRNDDGEGHLMDPETLRPARSAVARAVCAHQSAAVCDAYATALSVRPSLMDTLHEHGCSIALFTEHAEPAAARILDRSGVFTNATCD